MGAFLLRIGTGIVIVPLAVVMNYAWPWWSEAGKFTKILTAPLILPAIGLLKVSAAWWNDLK